MLKQAWQRRLNTPQTSAAGRLFDAAAALTGLCSDASFEGQGPMLLEAACTEQASAIELPLIKGTADVWQSRLGATAAGIAEQQRQRCTACAIFHASLADALLQQARQARSEHGINHIALGGGVFQNRVLTDQACLLLENDGFEVHLPEDIPVNDGGLCVGQVLEYAWGNRHSKHTLVE